jgi:ATP-dependent Clp protease ATP-binding subunit ClpA
MIAEIFGVADWNTLAAAIRRQAHTPREDASPHPFRQPNVSRELVLTLHRTLGHADQRNHEYATLEHLLLGLIDDADASALMAACKVDLGSLRQNLVRYIDNELKTLVTDGDREPTPTAAFQRAVVHAQDLDREATGSDVLLAIFDERESPAVWLLGEQEMTQYDATNFILYGIVKGNGDPAA